MTKTTAQISLHLAVEKYVTGYDFGDLFDRDDHGHLTDEQWEAVCDEAEGMLPDLTDDAPLVIKSRAEWAEANRIFRAEVNAERRAFGF